MKKHTVQRVLSFMLVLCMVVCMLPMAQAAEEDESNVPIALADQEEVALPEIEVDGPPYYVDSEETLRYAVNHAPDHVPGVGYPTEIFVTKDIIIKNTIHIPAGKWLNIRSNKDGETRTITGSVKSSADKSTGGVNLFEIVGNATAEPIKNPVDAHTRADFFDISMEGNQQWRLIYAYGNAAVTVGGTIDPKTDNEHCVTLTGGSTIGSPSGHGAGICVQYGGYLSARNVYFLQNKTVTGGVSSGGAAYLADAYGHFSHCAFKDNYAHSGGGIYFYGGANENNIGNTVLFVDECDFTAPNEANQRGGAIHCHGAGVISNTNFENQKSHQNGGAILVSSETTGGAKDIHGRLLLRGCTVTNNEAAAVGGGIYLADQASVFLLGEDTTVYGNGTSGTAFEQGSDNNIYYSGSGSKIIPVSKTGRIGVSTANPFSRKLAVYSPVNVPDDAQIMNRIIGQLPCT